MGDNDRVEQEQQTRAQTGLIISGVIIVLVAIFIAQNAESIPFEFLVLNFEAPLWLVLIIVFALGAVVGQGLMWMRRRAKRRKD
ncbi:MAG TPA: LapA family protein [Acidimicrobiia bacterium]|nr:LapA family protein [Acidimicrobiia bacterium]